MKIIAAIFATLALFPAVSSASQDTGAIPGSRVYAVSGSVFVTQGNNPAHRVIDSEPVVSNTLVSTGDKSAALLKFEDGQIVTLQSNSILEVRDYRYDAKRIKDSNIVLSMHGGGMHFVTGRIGKQNRQAFRLLTPNATINVHGTDFMVAMAGNSMYGQVLKGKISMTNAAGMKMVGAGQSVVVASSTAMASLVSTLAVPAGTFSELLSIPVDPSAIQAPAPASAPVPPVPSAEVGAAASVAGATAGIAGGTIAGVAGSESEPAQKAEAAPAPEETPEPAAAPAEKEMQTEEGRSGVGITGKVGTLGLGAELNVAFSDSFGARLGLNAFTYKYNANSSSVNYDFKLQLQTVSALADWYPFEGSFRTSAGLFYNNNKTTLNAVPGTSGYTINGVTYTATDVGSLQGTMAFNKVAPYLGIGWGNPVAKDKGWGMTTDIGVLFQGSPKTSLVATCGTAIAGTPTCTQLQSDAAAENTKLETDLKKFKLWPVISIGISYQW